MGILGPPEKSRKISKDASLEKKLQNFITKPSCVIITVDFLLNLWPGRQTMWKFTIAISTKLTRPLWSMRLDSQLSKTAQETSATKTWIATIENETLWTTTKSCQSILGNALTPWIRLITNVITTSHFSKLSIKVLLRYVIDFLFSLIVNVTFPA